MPPGEPAPDLQKRNLGIAYINAGMEHRSPPFVVRGYRMLTEVQSQFSNDADFFTSIGSALLLGKQTSEAEFAFERALQLNPDSATAETNAASAYLQGGDINQAVAHLERAVAIDPLHLPADMPLINLYKQQGKTAKADEISGRLSDAVEKNSVSSEQSEHESSSSAAQTAESVFKNIQVLKSIPSDQLIPTMRFITASLGVECSYCHVQEHFEKDDKKPKQIARDMMRMMLTIDKNSFAGYREVTCYSCHRGSLKPEGVPMIAGGTQAREQTAATTGAEKLTASLPTVDQVIERYIQSLGGAAAIGNVTSREERGTFTRGGKNFSIEVFDQDSNKRALIRHTPEGDGITVFDGREGWSELPGYPIQELHGADLGAARIDADLHFPLHLKQTFAELRMEYPERIGDRDAYVVLGTNEGQPPVKLYFDEQSGLLFRLVRYADSPLGLTLTQIDYGDYRDIEGLRVPFRRTIAEPDGISTIQLSEIRQNVPIDDARFAKPAASAVEFEPHHP
ncbi:MAG: c-type cytochrome [Candidatus Sulfotelmatobacter sp.]